MSRFEYRGAKTREISFPLGGIGTGCIGPSGWQTSAGHAGRRADHRLGLV